MIIDWECLVVDLNTGQLDYRVSSILVGVVVHLGLICIKWAMCNCINHPNI